MTPVLTSGGVAPVRARRIRPGSEQVHENVAAELGSEHLRDDVEVRDERRLQDDGDVGGVEELDGVGRVPATVADRLDREIDTEALEAKHSSAKEGWRL